MIKLAAAIRQTHILTKAIIERDTVKLKVIEKNAELFDEELDYLEQGGTMDELQSIYPTERIPYSNNWLIKVVETVTSVLISCLGLEWDSKRNIQHKACKQRRKYSGHCYSIWPCKFFVFRTKNTHLSSQTETRLVFRKMEGSHSTGIQAALTELITALTLITKSQMLQDSELSRPSRESLPITS